ncbi:hypothetical protein IE81DRAFT_75851 [Ceraceosorus guamensis]|uniref:Uncharacterized protein n=1 Tax=Ceraceosorus guamensis TaxID=1522189 RepID=A0A316W756_9BASI|nr:hypothetical protein IE81DRAFT_75851 [Ceraceosorus guamensis]PWN43475.1 hypothetical protein IE81DRAFT_75851 [Ceraceosorus guamensis]
MSLERHLSEHRFLERAASLLATQLDCYEFLSPNDARCLSESPLAMPSNWTVDKSGSPASRANAVGVSASSVLNEYRTSSSKGSGPLHGTTNRRHREHSTATSTHSSKATCDSSSHFTLGLGSEGLTSKEPTEAFHAVVGEIIVGRNSRISPTFESPALSTPSLATTLTSDPSSSIPDSYFHTTSLDYSSAPSQRHGTATEGSLLMSPLTLKQRTQSVSSLKAKYDAAEQLSHERLADGGKLLRRKSSALSGKLHSTRASATSVSGASPERRSSISFVGCPSDEPRSVEGVDSLQPYFAAAYTEHSVQVCGQSIDGPQAQEEVTGLSQELAYLRRHRAKMAEQRAISPSSWKEELGEAPSRPDTASTVPSFHRTFH